MNVRLLSTWHLHPAITSDNNCSIFIKSIELLFWQAIAKRLTHQWNGFFSFNLKAIIIPVNFSFNAAFNSLCDNRWMYRTVSVIIVERGWHFQCDKQWCVTYRQNVSLFWLLSFEEVSNLTWVVGFTANDPSFENIQEHAIENEGEKTKKTPKNTHINLMSLMSHFFEIQRNIHEK